MAFNLGSLDDIVSSVSSQAVQTLNSSSIVNGISGTVNQVIGSANSIANSVGNVANDFNNAINEVGNVANEVGRISNALNNLSNPAQMVSSLRSVNLPPGGNPYNYIRPGPNHGQYIRYGSNSGSGSAAGAVTWGGGSDWRVKLGDLVFPYTPSIDISGSAQWDSVPLVHQNVGFEAFQYSKPEIYSINAPFWVEDAASAEYWLNARDYLRTCTKMMGAAPPPILCFEGYGGTIEAPVIIISYSVNLAADINYIAAGGTYAPTKSSFNISLRAIYSINSPGFY